ncbi:MAG: beta strand repeat-containing protein [Planctomycetota bacterium]
MTATLSGGDLLISSTAAGDVYAEIASDGTTYTVSGTGLAATQFPIASVTGKIAVGDPAGIDGQTFRVGEGQPLANPLQVTASIETTELRAGINATKNGNVSILSPSVIIDSASAVSVSTSATNANITLSGAVTLRNDLSLASGWGTITLGSVAGSSSQGLLLGDLNQSGQVTIIGNVSLPNGLMITAAAAFGIYLEGATNSVAITQFGNTGSLRIGQAGGTSTFHSGLTATAPAVVTLAGVVETVDAPLRLGFVALRADTTLRSGSGTILTGDISDVSASRTLTLGSLTQTGEITLGGSVSIDDLETAAGDFGVVLGGSTNVFDQQVTFTNTKYVAFGDDTNDVSRFVGGVTATGQTAGTYLIGTVRTAGGAIDLGGAYLTGATTLDTSDAATVAGGAPITLRDGVRLASHVLTTIGGVGAAASPTLLLGTGTFGSGTTKTGSLDVQAGSLSIGDGATSVAALTVANDTKIRVAAGSLTVSAGSTIDAAGKSLTLLADDITIASAAGSIDAGRLIVAPVTAGRDVFLAATGTGLVLDATELQALDADTIQIGQAGYSGRVTLGTLTLADTSLAIVADGTGGGVTLDGPFTATGSVPGGMVLEITGSGAGTVLNGNITSTGSVFIDDAVELAAAVTIDTSGGDGDVYLTGGPAGIWSSKGEANDLVVRAGAGSVILASLNGLNDRGGQADLVRNVTATGGTILLGSGNVIAGGLSLGAPHVTLGAVVRAAGPISIDDGAGGDAEVVVLSNTVLDATQEGQFPAGNAVTIRGTVTALEANNYLFSLKAGTIGDVLVTGRIGFVGTGQALGTVTITGNDVTVAAIDGVGQGLLLEAVDGMGGADPGSVTLTGTIYKATTSLAIMVGSRDQVTNALGSPANRITLAGGATGTTTSFVSGGFDAEFSGNIDLAGRNMSVDTTNGGTATRSGLIWIYDAVDGAGTLTLDAGSGGNILVNHLTGATGGTTPLTGVTVTNGSEVGFFGDVKAGTVRLVDASDVVVFAGVLDITGGLVTEAQPYDLRFFGGNSGSSRIAGVTTFQNTGLLAFGNQGPPDVFTFVGGLVATAPSEVRLVASVLADSGSIAMGDADTDVTVLAATIGGAATSITLADVVLDANGGLILGTGLPNTIRVGSVSGTTAGFADALTIDTTGSVTITGSVGSGLDRLIVTKSGGTTFEAAVNVGDVTLTDTTGTITFQDDLTATTLVTAANGYTVAFQGAATTVTGNTSFLNTGWVWFGNDVGDVSMFTAGLSTSAGPINTVLAGTLASGGTAFLGETTLVTNVTFSGPEIRVGGALTGGSFGLTTSDPLSAEGGDAAFGDAVTVGYLSIFGTTDISTSSITTVGDQTYLKAVTISTASTVLRGAGATFGGIVSGFPSGLELDFDDGASLPQATMPATMIGPFRVSDGIVSGSAVVGSVTLTAAATLQVNATGTQPGSGYGQVSVLLGGTVVLGSAALSVTGSSPLPLGSILTIIDNGGSAAVSGTFAGLPEGALVDTPAGVMRVSYTGGDGNDVTLEAVTRGNVVSMEDDRLLLRLAGSGTTIHNLSTQYLPATRRLVLTVAADRPLSGGGTGLVVNPRAGTVTVNLAQLPQFSGIVVVGTGATDRITLGPQGVNLAALTAGAAGQGFAISTGMGADLVTVGTPVRTKGADGGFIVSASAINLWAAINTGLGLQRYLGQTRLVGDTSLTAGSITFDTKVDGARRLTLNASGRITFGDSIGGATPLKGITIQRAQSVESYGGLRLDGRGLGPTANGLVIGRGVGNVMIATDDPSLRPCSIRGFGGSGILFQGGSSGTAIGRVTLAGNGQGITILPGDYTGTAVVANTIVGSKRAGIGLDGAVNVTIGGGAAGLGNLIQGGAVPRLSGKGIVAKGVLTGTRVIGNTIERNNGGIVMQDARGLTVGGVGQANTITGNVAWGLVAAGNCTGSVLDANLISGNAPGDVNVGRARGLVVVPPA